MFKSILSKSVIAALALSIVLVGCSSSSKSDLKGSLDIDGSSTVYPLTAAIAEEFTNENPDVKITVSESGTGTGMKRFCANEIPVADASRPISEEEISLCGSEGVEYTELKVAIDGITVVVNKDNTWVKELTVEQLKAIFEQDSKVKNWSDIPGTTGFPDKKINLYTPGSASGTFEFFTEHINKTKKVQRVDQVTQSEDDNVLVTGIIGDKYAIGYFGFGYYEENMKKVQALNITDSAISDKAITPTAETISDNTYTLSRPLYVYVNNKSLKEDKVVKAFMKYYMENETLLAEEVLMVPLTEDEADVEADKLK